MGVFIFLGGVVVTIILIVVIMKPEPTTQRSVSSKPTTSVKKKSSTSTEKKLMSFLEEADDAYLQMFLFSDIHRFTKYASLSLLSELNEAISLPANKLYGYSDYGTRTWTIVHREKEQFIVKKELRYKNVKLRNKVIISLADDVDEEWTVCLYSGSFLVEDIESVIAK